MRGELNRNFSTEDIQMTEKAHFNVIKYQTNMKQKKSTAGTKISISEMTLNDMDKIL